MDLLNESQTRIGRRDKTLREIEESGIQLAEYIDRRNREDEETLEQFQLPYSDGEFKLR